MLIKARNTLAETAGKTFLTHTESAGTNVLRWKNPSQFSASWAVQVGETGEEQTEIVLLSTAAVSGTAGTLTANDSYEHPADTPLYAIKYNQIVFEVSTTGTAGTALAIAAGTVPITPDSEYTQFDHTAGSTTYAYKTAFRSSVLAVNSTESDWIIVTVPFYSLMSLRQRVKDKLWDATFVTDDQIDDWHNEFLDEMTNAMIDVNEDYNLGTANVSFSGTVELGTITDANFKQVRRVWMTSNDEDWYNATKMEMTQFLPDQEFNSTNPYFAMYDNNVILRRPNDASGTANVLFYKLTTKLSDDMDELPVPMRGYTKGFVDYSLIQAQYKDGKISLSEKKIAESDLIDRFKKELAPRSKSGPTVIDIVEDIGQGMDIEL